MNFKNKRLRVSCESANLAISATSDVILFFFPVDKDGELIYDLDTSERIFENFKAELKDKGKEDVAVISLPANIDVMFMAREESIEYLEDVIKMLREGRGSEQETETSHDEENS